MLTRLLKTRHNCFLRDKYIEQLYHIFVDLLRTNPRDCCHVWIGDRTAGTGAYHQSVTRTFSQLLKCVWDESTQKMNAWSSHSTVPSVVVVGVTSGLQRGQSNTHVCQLVSIILVEYAGTSLPQISSAWHTLTLLLQSNCPTSTCREIHAWQTLS